MRFLIYCHYPHYTLSMKILIPEDFVHTCYVYDGYIPVYSTVHVVEHELLA